MSLRNDKFVLGYVDSSSGFFTASSTITKGQILKISSPNQIAPTSSSTDKPIGVAEDSYNQGEYVSIIIIGLADIIADGPVTPGDVLGVANTTGRCIANNTINIKGNLSLPIGTALGRALTSCTLAGQSITAIINCGGGL